MATDLLRTLAGQIPSWQKRLQVLASESTSRQMEMAKFEKSSSQSTMSPLDTVKATTSESTPMAQLPAVTMNMDAATSAASQQKITHLNGTPRALKPPKPDAVYFDGSMQKYFEELVHFVAMSRNTMRKAKMAARVAQIRKMAQVDMLDESKDDTLEASNAGHGSSRRLESSLSAMPGKSLLRPTPTPGCEAFDTLDKKLDSLQSTSELAAFQFLRDASCTKHVQTVMKILADVLEASTAELTRVEKDEPDVVSDVDAVTARTTKRRLSMRKELSTSSQTADSPSKRQNKGSLAASPSIPCIEHMDIDYSALQNEEAIAPQTMQLQATLPA